VLYVDDDEVMALMVHSLLQRLGYHATCTLDAREAIAMVKRDPDGFDLVVTDFNMPNLSGVDVARSLARLRPGLPVVISSGYISDELRTRAADLNVRAVMQKEHTFEELGAVLHSILNAPERVQ
jgi:CheY-like chemotaxis protein